MTEESPDADEEASGAAEDEGEGGPPTEADVEAAREELAAVGSDGDESTATDAGDEQRGAAGNSDADDEPTGSAEDSDADDEPSGAVGGSDADDEPSGAAGPAPTDPEAAREAAEDPDDPVQAEDLVEDPEDRPLTGEPDRAESTDAGAGTAAEGDAVPAAGSDSASGTGGDADDPAGPAAEAAGSATAEPQPTDAAAGDASADAGADDAAAAETDAVADAGGDAEADAGADAGADDATADHQPGVPEDVRKYDRFKKVDGAQYDRVNEFLRERTYITAREWAIARLCSDFRTETGVEMTKIGENLPELVPFMTDTYTPQAVNQARASFEEKVRTAGATFLYGAMCDFFTAEELDDVMYEATEVAKFLLEVEGVELSVEEELEAEDRISAVMRDVRESSAQLRHEECPECGADLSGGE